MASKKARIIYLYTVAFISLAMLIMGLIFTTAMVLNVAMPNKSYSYNYGKTQTYGYEDSIYSEETTEIETTEKDNTIAEKNNTIAEKNKANQRMRDMLGGVIFIAIVAPVFGYHWYKIQKERKEV